LHQTLTSPPRAAEVRWHETIFSLAQARRALPYVARVASDAADAFASIQRCRIALQQPCNHERRIQLGQQRDAALQRLNAAIDECNAVGADLIDISIGVIRFNSTLAGRAVSLVWRLGDPVGQPWPGLMDAAMPSLHAAKRAAPMSR